MKNDRIRLAATGRIDLSKDPLSLKAAGVYDDSVGILPARSIRWDRVVLTGVVVTGMILSASELVKLAIKRMGGNSQRDGKLPSEKTVRAAYLVKQ